MKKVVLVILALGFSHHALAKEVYKCVVKGSVTYQSRPCAGTATVNPQQQLQQKLTQRTATQNSQQVRSQPEMHKYSQQQHLQRHSSNGTINEIPDTVEGKKKSLAIAQAAYQSAKDR
ncbi:MAG: hypothetical protein GAK29_01967 [Acinetobacter bereziniae]|uniref:DUF4124 domain-containing protein n=1 Tax=Acinetobacter bereziniae TaxID=106648 RepID=A0A833UR82_ACIBZ|nr:MAG: hypothetical protein GAK29_01967 [Acinetobacter bereziniae]